MYGHVIPVSVDDFINTIVYPVEIPEYAVPKHQLYDTGVLEQFSIPDKNNIVLTRITIAAMVDFCNRKVPFKILTEADITEIYRYLKEYTILISEYEESLEHVRDYLVQSRKLLSELDRSMKILAKRSPAIRKIINQERLTDIFNKPFEVK